MKKVGTIKLTAIILAAVLMLICISGCGEKQPERVLNKSYERVGLITSDPEREGYLCTYYDGATIDLYSDGSYDAVINEKRYEGSYNASNSVISIDLIEGLGQLHYYCDTSDFIFSTVPVTQDLWVSVRYA